MRHRVGTLFLVGVGLSLSGCVSSRPVSTETLLREMTDLKGLAEFPSPSFTCRQFSSYDRASTSAEDQKTWFANGDCGKYLRQEEHDGRSEYVMMDVDGPGAIVRIWSANPKGTLRVYLDHDDKPVLEVPMADLLSGKAAGVPEPIAHVRSAGWNCYLPIPYAEHCLVTSDEGGFYYHVNYRTYAPGTDVVTFTVADLETLAEVIGDTASHLASPGGVAPTAKMGSGAASGELVELQPGHSHTRYVTSEKPGAICELRVKVVADDVERALRQMLLTIAFDGQRTVACPLGDFFGAGPGVNAYESLPLGVTDDGEMWSHWVMPFRKTAQLDILNLDDQAVSVSLDTLATDVKWTDQSMYFHAGWRVERDASTRPPSDWNYVTVNGQGVFAGAAFAIANPVKQWWGEGDEKIYVDGELFPSHFGTGTEDYYGYAWCSPTPFTHAYHNQPRCDGPNNYGHTAVNRWHVLDRIPFEREFRFDMELWHWWEGRVLEMSVATYWYARPGATSNLAVPTADDLRLAKVPEYVASRVKGALEGEEMRVVAKIGTPGPQDIANCSNERHLWWRGAKPGDKLVLAFDAAEAGTHRVYGRFVKAHDYGIIRLWLNDKPAGRPIDFYNDGILVTDEILLGEFDLSAGDNRLTAEVIGANGKAVREYMFGLDYVRLERETESR